MPKTLPGRDPRNPSHVSAALGIIQALAGLHMLESSIQHVRRLNLPLPAHVKSHKVVRKGSMAIGSPFLLEIGLHFADCVLCPCNRCQMMLQFRPALGYSGATRWCAFCAAEQLLEEHWADQAKSRKRRKPV